MKYRNTVDMLGQFMCRKRYLRQMGKKGVVGRLLDEPQSQTNISNSETRSTWFGPTKISLNEIPPHVIMHTH